MARRMGYREADRAKDADPLATAIRETMDKVHGYFVRSASTPWLFDL